VTRQVASLIVRLRIATFAALAVTLYLLVTMFAVGDDRASDESEAKPCLATRVDGGQVRAGPFTGGIHPDYDVVGGRFRLRVGAFRDVADGLSQKIPWSVSRQANVGPNLRIDARRLPPLPLRTFRMNLRRVSGTGDQRRWFFPSVMNPPAEGCWRLRFKSGKATGSLTVRVQGKA